MSAPLAPAATRLVVALEAHGWTVRSREQTHGLATFGGLSETEDGNGRRRRVEVLDEVDSDTVQARHPDGRALVALWMRRASRKSWTLDMAWRGRAPGEHAPRQLTATQLKAYVTAPDLAAALAACGPNTIKEAA